MITQRLYGQADFSAFTELLPEQKFEYVQGQLIPLYANKPVEEALVDYVLSREFTPSTLNAQFLVATLRHATLVSNLRTFPMP